MKITKYALFSVKQNCLMGFSISSNSPAEFCSDTRVELTALIGTDNIWMTGQKSVADEASVKSSRWFNAGMESPMWEENYYGPLIVVEVEMSVKIPGTFTEGE